ncbi:hypothetical protein GTP23_12110 [Pseudoduganella sp. FT93W]|uniref:Uncharacterized protein n=1 Tax=Duganella fentianensis TaxID=2692177 RepID=A0A845I255_9BURK|nr:hypothetical protein [Duganella fentianensis]MYN45791.1 hypothetical protein [Duganella fentianensis]
MAAAPTDPWSAGFMALGSVAKAAGPAGPSSAISTAAFDNSGFTVNVGGGSASSNKTALPSPVQTMQAAAVHVGGLLSNPATVILVGLALFLYLKHK